LLHRLLRLLVLLVLLLLLLMMMLLMLVLGLMLGLMLVVGHENSRRRSHGLVMGRCLGMLGVLWRLRHLVGLAVVHGLGHWWESVQRTTLGIVLLGRVN
jgi:hypothetical protein